MQDGDLGVGVRAHAKGTRDGARSTLNIKGEHPSEHLGQLQRVPFRCAGPEVFCERSGSHASLVLVSGLGFHRESPRRTET